MPRVITRIEGKRLPNINAELTPTGMVMMACPKTITPKTRTITPIAILIKFSFLSYGNSKNGATGDMQAFEFFMLYFTDCLIQEYNFPS
jgi:hypothetical protein